MAPKWTHWPEYQHLILQWTIKRTREIFTLSKLRRWFPSFLPLANCSIGERCWCFCFVFFPFVSGYIIIFACITLSLSLSLSSVSVACPLARFLFLFISLSLFSPLIQSSSSPLPSFFPPIHVSSLPLIIHVKLSIFMTIHPFILYPSIIHSSFIIHHPSLINDQLWYDREPYSSWWSTDNLYIALTFQKYQQPRTRHHCIRLDRHVQLVHYAIYHNGQKKKRFPTMRLVTHPPLLTLFFSPRGMKTKTRIIPFSAFA